MLGSMSFKHLSTKHYIFKYLFENKYLLSCNSMYICTYTNISIILYIVPLHRIVDVDFLFKFLATLFA